MIFKYEQGGSLFHKLDPLSKVIWLVSMSGLAFYYEHTWGQLGLLIAAVICGRCLAGMSLFTIWRGMRIPLLFGLPYFILQLIFVPGDTVLVTLGTLVLTEEALDYAAAISLRLLTLLLTSLVFIVTTDPRDIVLTLAQKLFVPYRIAYAISIAFRFLPILEKEAQLIRTAQQLRGGGMPKGWRERFAWHKRFVVAVFVSAVQRVENIATMMDVKGFGRYRQRGYRRRIVISMGGKMLSILSVLVACGVILLS